METPITTGSTAMRRVAFLVADLNWESVTLKTTSNEPAARGVPSKEPVLGLMVRPFGRPPGTLQVSGCIPPLAFSVLASGSRYFPSMGEEMSEIARSYGRMLSVKSCSVDWPRESVAVILMGYEPSVRAFPTMRPGGL